MGEAAHVEGRAEEDLQLCVVSPDSNSVHVVICLRSGEENHRRDPTREERSVLFCLSSHTPQRQAEKMIKVYIVRKNAAQWYPAGFPSHHLKTSYYLSNVSFLRLYHLICTLTITVGLIF